VTYADPDPRIAKPGKATADRIGVSLKDTLRFDVLLEKIRTGGRVVDLDFNSIRDQITNSGAGGENIMNDDGTVTMQKPVNVEL